MIRMKKELMNILCCPVCKSDLTLEINEEKDDVIISGNLTCSSCKKIYRISEGIPNLLPK